MTLCKFRIIIIIITTIIIIIIIIILSYSRRSRQLVAQLEKCRPT